MADFNSEARISDVLYKVKKPPRNNSPAWYRSVGWELWKGPENISVNVTHKDNKHSLLLTPSLQIRLRGIHPRSWAIYDDGVYQQDADVSGCVLYMMRWQSTPVAARLRQGVYDIADVLSLELATQYISRSDSENLIQHCKQLDILFESGIRFEQRQGRPPAWSAISLYRHTRLASIELGWLFDATNLEYEAEINHIAQIIDQNMNEHRLRENPQRASTILTFTSLPRGAIELLESASKDSVAWGSQK